MIYGAWMYVPLHLHAGTREMNISFLTRRPTPQTYIFHLAIAISLRGDLLFRSKDHPPLLACLSLSATYSVVKLRDTCRFSFRKFVNDPSRWSERVDQSSRIVISFCEGFNVAEKWTSKVDAYVAPISRETPEISATSFYTLNKKHCARARQLRVPLND